MNSLSDIRRASFLLNSGAEMFRETAVSIAITGSSGTVASTMNATNNITYPLPGSSFSALDGVPRGKAVFFLKRASLVVTVHNFHNDILFGDLPMHSKVETLAVLLEQIYIPLLSNSLNKKLWPETVFQDLNDQTKGILNKVQEVSNFFYCISFRLHQFPLLLFESFLLFFFIR